MTRFDLWGFPGGTDGIDSAFNDGDQGLIAGWGRSPGEGNGNTTLVFLPIESHGQRARAGKVYGVTKNQTSLTD